MTQKQLAKRDNANKTEWHNFPLFLLEPLMRVAQYGSKKYEKYNFLRGAPISQYTDCIMRHMEKFSNPDLPDLDDESLQHHLAHAAWNCLVAIWVLENMPDLDDRWKGADKK